MNETGSWPQSSQLPALPSTTGLLKTCSILATFVFSLLAVSAETQLTPMMAQYRRIKGELPKDALLLFRLGDFYELFFEDAQTGAHRNVNARPSVSAFSLDQVAEAFGL